MGDSHWAQRVLNLCPIELRAAFQRIQSWLFGFILSMRKEGQERGDGGQLPALISMKNYHFYCTPAAYFYWEWDCCNSHMLLLLLQVTEKLFGAFLGRNVLNSSICYRTTQIARGQMSKYDCYARAISLIWGSNRSVPNFCFIDFACYDFVL